MKALKELAYASMLLLASCTVQEEMKELTIDFETKVPLEVVEEHLQIDSLICISANGCFISRFDKMIPSGDYIYVLDTMQGVVFKIDMPSKTFCRFIDKAGSARDEYIGITDIAVDVQGNLLVYDSESAKVNVYDSLANYVRTVKVNRGTSLAVSPEGQMGIDAGQMEEAPIFVYSADGKGERRVRHDVLSPNVSFDNVRGIAQWKDGFVFTVPFDYHIYMTDGESVIPLVNLNCGKRQCDVESLKKLDFMACREAVFGMSDKIMYFSNIAVYDGKFFLSTDLNDQLLYDSEQDSVLVVSNVEAPYNILFSTPLFVNAKGQFCCVTTGSNMVNAYLPFIEVKGAKSPKLHIKREEVGDSANSFWIMTGKVK